MITEFRIGLSRTINLGNFESVRVESNVTVSVQDPSAPLQEGGGMSPNEFEKYYTALKEAAQKELRALLEETYRAQMMKGKRDERTDQERTGSGNGGRLDAPSHGPGNQRG